MTIMTKTEFSRHCKVDKSRVSQWLKAKQIGPHCLIGEGRNAKIDVDLALADLRKKLDVDQRFGLNGLNTRLDRKADTIDEADDDGMAEIVEDQQRYVTLDAAKGALDELWVLVDLTVQETLLRFPNAFAAYQEIHGRLADAKWRLQGVKPPPHPPMLLPDAAGR